MTTPFLLLCVTMYAYLYSDYVMKVYNLYKINLYEQVNC